MKTGKEGKNLIKMYEGFRAFAYLCPAGVMTIGFGTTKINGKPILENQKVTIDEANVLLEQDLKRFEDSVNNLVKVSLSQNQFDALVSFVYNLGAENFKKSTLLKKINVGEFSEAADEFLKWNKAKGKVLPGLTRRREAERLLFLR
jgi:lysozyme